MSHAPPVPDAAQAPWPAHPAPIEKAHVPDEAVAGDAAATETGVSARTLTRIGVGAAIGSAAIAAALLYVNHGRSK